MGIGRVGESSLKIDHSRFREDPEGELRRDDINRLEMKITATLDSLEQIRKMALVVVHHLVAVTVDIDKHFSRNNITINGYAKIKILLLSDLESRIINNERKGCRALKMGSIMGDAMRWLGK
jgi:hypothetical protein